jgi:hypothetical protein
MSNNNPLKILSQFAPGLTQNDVKKIWEDVKANQTLLRSCKRHDFQPFKGEGENVFKYRCSRCLGEVDAVKRMWYEEGVRHATFVQEDDLK